MPETTSQRTSIADLSAELFAFCFNLRHSKDPGPVEPVRIQADKLFKDFEQAARGAGYRPETIQNCKYALVAFVDELVLGSNWPMKEAWSGNPLQLEYFNDFAAGEEFYKKLSAIRSGADAERLDMLEVYFLALAHGFKGMYIDLRGMEERKTLTEQLGAEITAGRGGAANGPLSPRAMPPDQLPKLARTAPTWLVPAICLAVLILLAMGLVFAINRIGESAAEAMTSGGTAQ
ncbi:MAG: DotU family type IV/VI secretion system protein [Planctomycetes bacterium]|jgi:type VI secretion system protein ImpK|nr:DotU family type IV/VI secretion system protein [Planctomycetota bacterium]MCL4730374.1 type IVB secretion system protein IcmH/DotU [Planctomycetota bacterium]